MTLTFKPARIAGVALIAGLVSLATPAAAQVNGIATSSPEAVIVSSKARNAAYKQINDTYAAQIQQLTTMQQELQTLQKSLDTNNDGNVTQAEADAKPTVMKQIDAKEQQIGQAQEPIALAQYFVIEQLLNALPAARNEVVQKKKIQIMLAPEAFQYAPDGIDVSADLLAALDEQMPTVSAFPPAGYQPRRDTVATHQAVQQIILAAIQRQAAQQAAQGQQGQAPAQPQGDPNAPTGR